MIHLWEAELIASDAHRGQTDKNGVPYIEHALAVAAGLRDFPLEVQVAGVLHDVVEDTGWSLEDLLVAGVTKVSLRLIDAVTKVPGSSKEEQIHRVITVGGYSACLVKISDNAHNSLPDRLKHLDGETRKRLERKYREAREKLWSCVSPEDIEKILRIVNPSLLAELAEMRREAGL